MFNRTGLVSIYAGVGLAIVVSLATVASHHSAFAQFATPVNTGGPPVPSTSPAVRVQAEARPVYSFDIGHNVKQGEVLPVLMSARRVGALEQSSIWMYGKQFPVYPVQGKDGFYEAHVSVDLFRKAGGYTLKVQNRTGETIHQQKVEVVDAHYPIQNIRVSGKTQGLQALPGEMEAIGALKKRVTPVKFWEGAFVSPVPDCQNSPFGVKRYYNGKPSDNYHKGVDLRSPSMRPIKAPNAGKVVVQQMFRLHGGTVGLDHGQGITSVYIHMAKFNVKNGQMVNKGDVIGYVGSTGFATGPHLHWGLYVNGNPVNPNQWVKGVKKCG